MARRRRPVVSLLRQRAVGIRRTRPDAPPRREHQRHRNCGKGPPLSLGSTWAAAGRCAGTGREPVLVHRITPGVVPAKAGTIRRGLSIETRCSTTSLSNERRGVWVPAFAGTTSGEGLRRRLLPRQFGLVELELLGNRLGDAGAGAQPLVIGFHGRPLRQFDRRGGPRPG